MKVNVTPETARKLNQLCSVSGRPPADIVEDALAGYLNEAQSIRATLESRYDDLAEERMKAIDGEEALRRLRKKSKQRRSDAQKG